MADDDNQANKILQDTKKILFAEDLVNYMLQKNALSTIVFSTESNERERKNGVSIFDKNLRMAADDMIVGLETDRLIMDYNLDDIEMFHFFANAIKKKYLRSTTYTESFFHYSVYLAHLAAKLYEREIKEAPRIAVHYIMEGMDLDRFNSRSAIFVRFGYKYANNQQQSSPDSSSWRDDPRYATPGLPLLPGESMDNVEQPSSQRQDETYVQAIDLEMSIPHQHLKRRKVTAENIHTEKYIGEKAYECVEDQHYVDNKKMDADIAMIPSYSSFEPLSYLEYEETQKFVRDPPNLNTCNVSSLGPIGVPASPRGKNINFDSPE